MRFKSIYYISVLRKSCGICRDVLSRELAVIKSVSLCFPVKKADIECATR